MTSNILGIDIGSISIGLAALTPQKQVVFTAYGFHHGNIPAALTRLLKECDLSRISVTAATSSTPAVIQTDTRYDGQVSIITAARHFHEQPGAILLVGGEKFGLTCFDENGNYLNFKTNTSCATGTGSFLDQQSGRLNLPGIEALSSIAFENKGNIPKIASRCAVFAKTDLIHAQQEGYSLGEICDGLCLGLAKNIVDTLFSGERIMPPVICCGGVSKNKSVIEHIQSILGVDLVTGDLSHLYGAVGAALCCIEENRESDISGTIDISDIIIPSSERKTFFYPPLELSLSEYPDFHGHTTCIYQPEYHRSAMTIEVDLYENIEHTGDIRLFLGLDIGSTSTKAVLINDTRRVLAGFYTRTAGRPVDAVCGVFEAMDHLLGKMNCDAVISGAGTTGSGRKFIGKLIGADMVLDEITAHARAACELNPDVDTIIEIGGQDSKFTTLKNGYVTFSVMNTVCAAGTGSFIEEQAMKLGVPLSEYSSMAESTESPIASDRCTVFMERDINYYLSKGYNVNEILAAVLHSVRENYLGKVAVESSIGNTVLFQGATAKNKALVAAFEQRLKQPVLVSRYCHLTGAMGAALTLIDENTSATNFRGLDLYKKEIPISSEVCELCTNHCKITVADIDGESTAFGFLCGRDYHIRKYVNNNRSGFDLIQTRKKISAFTPQAEPGETITIGIPAALHLFDDVSMWRYFFDLLDIPTITSENYKSGVKEGKHLTGAEFCAPITAMHGHAKSLLDKADYVFLPLYMEEKQTEKGFRRQHCYYTQFAPPLISASMSRNSHRFLMPLCDYLYSRFHIKIELYRMLKSLKLNNHIRFMDVSMAYDRAIEYKNTCSRKLKQIYSDLIRESGDISVVFIGRPYTILSPAMNNKIPNIFSALGIKTFYQDMLTYTSADVADIQLFLKELHWKYAAKILESAEVVAKTKGVYPVMITSFMCSPDSFAIDYFKKIMDAHDKPYLILQLDEHDSSVGYETRIEAAIRSFRNHHHQEKTSSDISYPEIHCTRRGHVRDRIFIMPNWDSITTPLLAANLRREGYDVRCLEETRTMIRKSLRHNTGQCIPLNIIAQEYMDYIEMNNLDPANTLLWMVSGELACNLKLYPFHIQSILDRYGFKKASVYCGNITFVDISLQAGLNAYFAYMFGGLIRKIGCRLRPYEVKKGMTDTLIRQSIDTLKLSFMGKLSKEDALSRIISDFKRIETIPENRPKVAVFGDLYARDNDVMNQNLIRCIENNGGEVITTPYSTYAKMIAGSYFQKWYREGKYLYSISTRTMMATLQRMEKRYYHYFEEILGERDIIFDEAVETILAQYNLRKEHTGESMDNILKIHYLKKHYPDLALFVQTNPAFCCPSIITEAMSRRIEQKTGVPVVSITYDGTGGQKNDRIIPYLKFPRNTEPEPGESVCAG